MSGEPYVRMFEALQDEIAELNSKLLRVVRGEFTQICSYCGWESTVGGNAEPEAPWNALQDHIQCCVIHPIYELKAEITQLKKTIIILHDVISAAYDELDPSDRMSGCECEPDTGYVCAACIFHGSKICLLLSKSINATAEQVAVYKKENILLKEEK